MRIIFTQKSVPEIAIFVSVTVGASIQAYALFKSLPETHAAATWQHVASWIFHNALMPLFGSEFGTHNSRLSATVALIATAGLATGCIAGLSPPWRLRASIMLAFAFAILLLASRKFDDATLAIVAPFGGGQRYFYIPYAMFAWSLYLVATKTRPGWRVVGIAGLSLVAASSAHSFVAPPLVDLHWRAQVEAVHGEGEIPINPPGWTVHIIRTR